MRSLDPKSMVTGVSVPVAIQVFMFDPAWRAGWFVIFLLIFGFIAFLLYSGKDPTK